MDVQTIIISGVTAFLASLAGSKIGGNIAKKAAIEGAKKSEELRQASLVSEGVLALREALKIYEIVITYTKSPAINLTLVKEYKALFYIKSFVNLNESQERALNDLIMIIENLFDLRQTSDNGREFVKDSDVLRIFRAWLNIEMTIVVGSEENKFTFEKARIEKFEMEDIIKEKTQEKKKILDDLCVKILQETEKYKTILV